MGGAMSASFSRDNVRSAIIRSIRSVDGHADVWGLFHDAEAFAAVAQALADPFREDNITQVVGIEARGFVLGTAVARELGTGFVAVRKESGLLPGELIETLTEPDYRGNRTTLRLQRGSLGSADRVVMVDDWFETGSQARATLELVGAAGAEVMGAAVVVDETDAQLKALFAKYQALIDADEFWRLARETS
jgi:adenine phosphoribosyltransferase